MHVLLLKYGEEDWHFWEPYFSEANAVLDIIYWGVFSFDIQFPAYKLL